MEKTRAAAGEGEIGASSPCEAFYTTAFRKMDPSRIRALTTGAAQMKNENANLLLAIAIPLAVVCAFWFYLDSLPALPDAYGKHADTLKAIEIENQELQTATSEERREKLTAKQGMLLQKSIIMGSRDLGFSIVVASALICAALLACSRK
jgi:hypothetical protein